MHAGQPHTGAPHLVLYDGDCGVCGRFARFLRTHDRRRLFQLTPRDDEGGRRWLARVDPSGQLDSIVVVVNHRSQTPRALVRSRAILFVLRSLGGVWRAAAAIAALVPRPLLDAAYDRFARHRTLLNSPDRCEIPDAPGRHLP